MQTRILFFSILLSLLSCVVIGQISGGPDAFGNRWRTNKDSLGQAYNWIDIKTKGIKISGLGDDNTVGPYLLKFPFNYYGHDYDSIWIGSNGYIAFQFGVAIASPLPSIPVTGGRNTNFVAPMLSDLTFIDGSNNPIPHTSAYYYTNKKDTFIVQWDSIPFWSNAPTPIYPDTLRNCFQAIFNGTNGTITFQYKMQRGKSSGTGNTVVVGIENKSGIIGLQSSLNVYPLENSTIQFYNPAFSTNDLPEISFSVSQNLPNPAHLSTSINYTLYTHNTVQLIIQNILGEEIGIISLGDKNAGNHSYILDTGKMTQGVYFYSLRAGNYQVTKKMIISY